MKVFLCSKPAVTSCAVTIYVCRYGSTRIAACELSAGDVVTVFFAVIIGSFSLGNALPELETFATALGSATVVFEVIDRVMKNVVAGDCITITERCYRNQRLTGVLMREKLQTIWKGTSSLVM